MAGGVGSRIWPYSTNEFPKQFHDLLGTGKSLLQHTVDRFSDFCPLENIYIVTNENYKDIVYQQIPELCKDQVLLEPEGRNTAPCIAYASYKIHQTNPEAVIVVSPSDHLILRDQMFKEKLNVSVEDAKNNNHIITMGITPNRPNTGFGYIKFKEGEGSVLPVEDFTEKPNLEKAKEFVAAGNYLWNAGIFIWKAEIIKKAFEEYLPELHKTFTEGEQFYYTEKEDDFIKEVYPTCENISIDYGIMEKAEDVFVVPSDIGWSDLGTWTSLYEIKDKDDHGNAVEGNVHLYDSFDNIIKISKDKTLVVQGLRNFIIAEKGDVLMICSKEKEQMVKEFVKKVKK